MAKITYHWSLHLAVKDAFLGRLVFVSVLLLNKLWNEFTNPRKNGLNGKEHKFRGFPGASRSFILYSHSKGNGNVY